MRVARTNHYFYIGQYAAAAKAMRRFAPSLLAFSRVEMDGTDPSNPHIHSHLELFYYVEGEGFVELGGKRIPVQPHDLVIVDAGQLHMQYPRQTGQVLSFYNFSADTVQLEGLPMNTVGREGIYVHSFGTPDNFAYAAIGRMEEEVALRGYAHFARMGAIFTEMLVDVLRLRVPCEEPYPDAKRWRTASAMLAVKDYIDTHYAEELELCALSAIAKMQKSSFLHLFRETFGVPPMRYLNMVRLENAKLMLQTTDAPVTQIAFDVGFNSPAYFSEMFRRMEGLTPSEYRTNGKRIKSTK